MNKPKTTEAFDSGARTYDQDFTNTILGRTQRARVWKYLESILRDSPLPVNILEINCGTGEDAIYLAKKGHQVLATDISEAMLNQARLKADEQKLPNINFLQIDIQDLEQIATAKKYDLIFSNFGGLNCLHREEISQLPKRLKTLLSENGHVVLVLMPIYCLVEDLYMLSKGQLGKMFRRNKRSEMVVQIGYQKVPTWYYSPKFLRKIFQEENFKVNKIMVVGFTPSYLNPYLEKRPNLFRIWNRIGDLLHTNSRIAFVADHYLIHFMNSNHKS
jgi:2-polyprenyl-3-methyl-5-hydroxy-6-metoxy-1,4-benzoquinol methylase